MNMTAYERRFRLGVCEDCAAEKSVTQAVWWVSGFTMILCAECVEGYEAELLKPGNASHPYWVKPVDVSASLLP